MCVFLFHTGSIKRQRSSLPKAKVSSSFLFHTGSIKRMTHTGKSMPCERFYSILVRLKDCRLSWRSFPGIGFYSILVRLKGDTTAGSLQESVSGFYSILVRLKVRKRLESYDTIEGFYSILVRLKVCARWIQCTGYGCFYSILVRLKVCAEQNITTQEFLVSIPYWFD